MKILSVEPRIPKALKQGIEAVHNFLPDAVFHFSEEGVRMASIDPSQIVYVEFFAPRQFFSRYTLASPEVRVPISLTELSKILSRLGQADRILLELEDVELHVYVESGGGRIRKEFRLGLIDVSEQEFNMDLPQDLARVELPAGVLRDALKDAALFSNSVILRASPGTFVVEAKGSGGSTRTIVRSSPSVSIETAGDKASRYSLPFLTNILKEADADTQVSLQFSTDSPILIKYSIQGIRLSFFLAHMIL